MMKFKYSGGYFVTKSKPTFIIFSLQFLDIARTLEGYGTVVFPHCACDARKSGHVIVSISLSSFRLQACSDQGDREVSIAAFNILPIYFAVKLQTYITVSTLKK